MTKMKVLGNLHLDRLLLGHYLARINVNYYVWVVVTVRGGSKKQAAVGGVGDNKWW
jgi:hypothetical protein